MTGNQFDGLLRESLEQSHDEYIDIKDEWFEPFDYSVKFERKIKLLTKKSIWWDIPKIKLTPKWFIILTIMITLLAVTALTTYAGRKMYNRFYVDDYKDHIVFEPVDSDSNGAIEQEYEITYDMSEFNLDLEEKTKKYTRIRYSNSFDNMNISVMFSQRIKGEFNETTWSGENAELYTLTLDGVEALYWEQTDNIETTQFIIWEKGEYVFSITGTNIEKDKLLAIANSIKTA
jgi:hypothetical protein